MFWYRVGEQKVYFYFFKRCERYIQEMLPHSFICLPLPYLEIIVFICNIDLYCVIAIFNGTADMFKRWYFYTLNTNWGNKSNPRSLTLWCSRACLIFRHSTMIHTELQTNSYEQQGVNFVVWIDVSTWREVLKVYLLIPDVMNFGKKYTKQRKSKVAWVG